MSFDEVDEYVKKYVRSKYVGLYPPNEEYERVFQKIKYLIIKESNISDVYYHIWVKIKINSGDNLLLEKTLNMNNLVKSVNSY